MSSVLSGGGSSMARSRIVVEFIGLPGSGKSVVSHAVVEDLRRMGIAVDEPAYVLAHRWRISRRVLTKLYYVGRFMARQPRLACGIVRSLWPSYSISDIRCLTNLFLTVSLVAMRGSCEIRVLDQGVLQALWSIEYRRRDSSIARLAKQIAKYDLFPEVVVVLRVPIETAMIRLNTRPGHGSVLERPEMGEADWQSAAVALEEVERLAQDIGVRGGNTRMIRVDDAQQDIGVKAGRVVEELYAHNSVGSNRGGA
jgi:hypothetical protein